MKGFFHLMSQVLHQDKSFIYCLAYDDGRKCNNRISGCGLHSIQDLFLTGPFLKSDELLEGLLRLCYCEQKHRHSLPSESFQHHLQLWKEQLEYWHSRCMLLISSDSEAISPTVVPSSSGDFHTPPYTPRQVGPSLYEDDSFTASQSLNLQRPDTLSSGLATPPDSNERLVGGSHLNEPQYNGSPIRNSQPLERGSTNSPSVDDDGADAMQIDDPPLTPEPVREAASYRAQAGFLNLLYENAKEGRTTEPGYCYAFRVIDETTNMVKIGFAECVAGRYKGFCEHTRNSQIVFDINAPPIHWYERAESLSHWLLDDWRTEPPCDCPREPGKTEWFSVNPQVAERTTTLTSAITEEVYLDDGSLKAPWKRAIKYFDANARFKETPEELLSRIENWFERKKDEFYIRDEQNEIATIDQTDTWTSTDPEGIAQYLWEVLCRLPEISLGTYVLVKMFIATVLT